jgi:hypothetical protein
LGTSVEAASGQGWVIRGQGGHRLVWCRIRSHVRRERWLRRRSARYQCSVAKKRKASSASLLSGTP